MKVLIIAGGQGTRLWPISKRQRPKQLQTFVSDKSLLQETVSRAETIADSADIFVVVSDQFQLAEVSQQLPQIPADNILQEPIGKNTLAAITYGQSELLRRGFEDELVTILYADHAIPNSQAFAKTIKRGEAFLKTHPDRLLVTGVKPTYPETGYGYIEMGAEIAGGVCEVKAFREKPNLETAEEYLQGGRYLWNAGIFQWRLTTFLSLLKKLAPEFVTILKSGDLDDLVKAYQRIPAEAIDYAIFEKDPDLAVLPTDLIWRDIGHWQAVKKHRAETGSDLVEGKHLGIDTEDTLIISQGKKPIVTIGLKNFIIIDTDEALLVLPAERAQDVKKALEQMAADADWTEHL
jgi:mannose-1-phosphate guanylyltransferase